jgi:Uma2 family endonuclease
MQKVIEVSQYELERGKPMPSKFHSLVQGNLYFQLRLQYGERYNFMPELSLELSDWESVPDIAVFPKSEIVMAVGKDEIRVTEAPMGAIEIISPSQSIQEMLKKASQYFAHGVRSCWLVIPEMKNVFVFSDPATYQMFKDGETLADAILDVELELNKVFG